MHIDQARCLRRTLAAVVTLVAFVPLVARAGATRIDVVLEDHSTNPRITGMVMAVTPSMVKAGQVVLHAVNASHDLVHEAVLVRLDDPAKTLPLDSAANKVQEKSIQDLGEVPDLPPLKSGDLTATLTPGRYALICNQPGHYMAGMVAELTVTQ